MRPYPQAALGFVVWRGGKVVFSVQWNSAVRLYVEKSLVNDATDDLNAQCLCITLDRANLFETLKQETGTDLFADYFKGSHAAVISDVPVFIDQGDLAKMADIISAIESVAKLDQFQAAALASAPDIARYRPGAVGVLMGYDFHLGAGGPKLIEINTNAGGAMINAYVSKAQMVCCGSAIKMNDDAQSANDPKILIFESFLQDWRRQCGDRPLKTIAIVDENPEDQFFYPELLLFKDLFERSGIHAIIASLDSLRYDNGVLWFGETEIDLVYNRVTDFMLETPGSAALKSAYLSDNVVLTPNPRAHALLANKRNLSLFSDEDKLRSWGVCEDHIMLLVEGIPKTVMLDPAKAEEFWAERRKLFFKPAAGYGGKAAYRGDKITRRVWREIVDSDYVAQTLIRPSTRKVIIDGEVQTMKVDVRNYTYDGTIQLTAARLYQGQITNMRTIGGGFSPAFATNLIDQCACKTTIHNCTE
jgi:hypothetical protein